MAGRSGAQAACIPGIYQPHTMFAAWTGGGREPEWCASWACMCVGAWPGVSTLCRML